MDALDPRHGSNAGYQAHSKAGERSCTPCRDAYTRFRKHVEHARRNGEQLTYTSNQVRAAIQPWLDMALTPSAVAWAAGLGEKGGRLSAVLTQGFTVRRATYHALNNVTEHDFSPYAKVYGNLTRQRIFSLMAAGHRLEDMPLNTRGQWRCSPLVSVALARNVRSHFNRLDATVGDSLVSASRARNARHVTPLAWDDPGTLAWAGERPLIRASAPTRKRRNPDDLDEARVQRLLGGERVDSTKAERLETMRRWIALGNSQRSLTERMGWQEGRYVTRERESA